MLVVNHYVAVVKNVRNFPDLTFTITETNANDSAHKYHAESDYAYWTPENPMAPYRHSGSGQTIEDAVRSALNTFELYPVNQLSDDKVFITKGHAPYQNEQFIDGTGKACSYTQAASIINANNMVK